MSEFIHKTEIVSLKQSNAELSEAISKLKTDLNDLNYEIEHLRRENPEDLKQLKARLAEYEQRETEFKKRILSISKEAKDNNKKHVVVKQFLSALQVENATIVETAIERHYKKRGLPKIIVAFLLGVLVTLVLWLASTYQEGDKFYNTIIDHINKLVN